MKWLLRTAPALFAGVILLMYASNAQPPVALAVPANDDLAAALEITFQPYTDRLDTTGATTEGSETTAYGGCQGDFATPVTGATVWYKYTHADPNETLQLDTLGGATDAVIAVYSGTSATYGALTFIACGDADQSLGPLYNDAGLTFAAVNGTTYYIQLGGFGGSAGMQVLNLSHVVSTGGTLFTVNSTGDTGDPDSTADGVCDDGAFNSRCARRSSRRTSWRARTTFASV